MVDTHLLGLRTFRLGMIQMSVGVDKAANLVRATSFVKEAASNGAKVIALPVSTENVVAKRLCDPTKCYYDWSTELTV